jgi:thiamine biosynthesis lipoprotein ApbE
MKLLIVSLILLASCGTGETKEQTEEQHKRDSLDKVIDDARIKSDSLIRLADEVQMVG